MEGSPRRPRTWPRLRSHHSAGRGTRSILRVSALNPNNKDCQSDKVAEHETGFAKSVLSVQKLSCANDAERPVFHDIRDRDSDSIHTESSVLTHSNSNTELNTSSSSCMKNARAHVCDLNIDRDSDSKIVNQCFIDHDLSSECSQIDSEAFSVSESGKCVEQDDSYSMTSCYDNMKSETNQFSPSCQNVTCLSVTSSRQGGDAYLTDIVASSRFNNTRNQCQYERLLKFDQESNVTSINNERMSHCENANNSNKGILNYCMVVCDSTKVQSLSDMCSNYIKSSFSLHITDEFIRECKARSVVNLSNYELSEAQLSVLQKGLTFCPTPGEPDMAELKRDLDSFHRKVKLRAHFGKKEGKDTAWAKKNFILAAHRSRDVSQPRLAARRATCAH